jgi:hypothetical protein
MNNTKGAACSWGNSYYSLFTIHHSLFIAADAAHFGTPTGVKCKLFCVGGWVCGCGGVPVTILIQGFCKDK